MKKPDPRRTVTAVMTLAHQRAKKAVLAHLRAQGLRPGEFSARQITLMAEDYFAKHMEPLITEAVNDVMTWPGFARWRDASVCKAIGFRTLAEHEERQQRTIHQ